MNYTLSYSEGVAGWVSFYSYYPDWMIGMNNYFYTFKGGNLYKHNVNNLRNTFYQPWWTQYGQPANAFTSTSIQTVFNNAALENKLFKTLNIEGDAPWGATLETDLQVSGFIDQSWFEKKEAAYFAFVRNNSIGEFALRSLNGIGNSLTVTGAGTNAAQVNFSINPLVSIGNIISIGDYVYFGTSTQFAGTVVNVIVDYPAGLNRIIINNNMLSPLSIPIPGNINYFLYVKNSVAESHGVLGHYCTTTLSNNYNSKIELFAVEANAMKSFP
jgi:fumarate reductase subunit C